MFTTHPLIAISAGVGLLVAGINPFEIDWYTVDCGGGRSEGGTFTLEGTFGQHDAGPAFDGVLSGGALTLTGGFWAGAQSRLCPADFNADFNLNADDLSDFITCYFQQVAAPGSCPAADFNADGDYNPDDLSDFITAYFTGCGP